MDPKEKELLEANHKSALESAVAKAASEAATAAKTNERARIAGVLASAEAEGRTELARHLALTTDMTAEQAEGILKMSPKAAASGQQQQQSNRFDQSMNQNGGPGVGADSTENTQEESDTDRILKDQATIMGDPQKQQNLRLVNNGRQ